MASTKTTTYSIYGRQAYENSFHGDTVNLDLSQGRSGVSQATTRIGAAVDELRRGSQGGQAYVYDNIARQPEVPPVHMPVGEPEYRQKTSRQVLKNRRRALSMNTAYAVFLASAAIFAVVICFLYLRLQSETVARSENITALQRELAEQKEVFASRKAQWDNEKAMIEKVQGLREELENVKKEIISGLYSRKNL